MYIQTSFRITSRPTTRPLAGPATRHTTGHTSGRSPQSTTRYSSRHTTGHATRNTTWHPKQHWALGTNTEIQSESNNEYSYRVQTTKTRFGSKNNLKSDFAFLKLVHTNALALIKLHTDVHKHINTRVHL